MKESGLPPLGSGTDVGVDSVKDGLKYPDRNLLAILKGKVPKQHC